MSNPILVEVLRGAQVESRHRGAVAVVDGSGDAVLSLGDIDRPTFPRSAVKVLQALPLIETGAADRFGLSAAQLALACASHNGEPEHVAAAQAMLAQAGLDASALRCGAHPPIHPPSAAALYASGAKPSALHNNCSGKHSGFLCLACTLGAEPRSYVEPEQPVQRAVKATIESLSGFALPDERRATDGCSVPTWAVPLKGLALAFARVGTGQGLGPERAKAAARLRAACAAHPWYVAGTGRFCTEVMQLLGARAFVKTGAEGVFCGTFPDGGLGFAVKCDDGGGRAAELVTAALIARFVKMTDAERAVIERLLHPVQQNWNGIKVGVLRPSEALLAI